MTRNSACRKPYALSMVTVPAGNLNLSFLWSRNRTPDVVDGPGVCAYIDSMHLLTRDAEIAFVPVGATSPPSMVHTSVS